MKKYYVDYNGCWCMLSADLCSQLTGGPNCVNPASNNFRGRGDVGYLQTAVMLQTDHYYIKTRHFAIIVCDKDALQPMPDPISQTALSSEGGLSGQGGSKSLPVLGGRCMALSCRSLLLWAAIVSRVYGVQVVEWGTGWCDGVCANCCCRSEAPKNWFTFC